MINGNCCYCRFTVNPRRWIRQHNGEITSGARRTKSKRPWEMILCVYGFPTNVSALQLMGNFFSTKYMKNTVGSSSLPEQMKVQFYPMDELPCYTGDLDELEDNNLDDVDEDTENGGPNRLVGAADISVGSIPEVGCPPVDFIILKSALPNDLSTGSHVDGRLYYSLIDTPVKTPLSSNSGFVKTVEPDKVVDVLSPNKCQQTPLFADKNQPPPATSLLTTPKVEVIDIRTPSSDYMINSFHRKKKRNDWVSQKIIDLTKSPDFVQL
ncbi:hypothetical protein IFM89_000471 [Coptis chinensis]|uniref:GIY-YIG domain-containing protein n=1 Tax=Coptis chinensis TaxID=261450 RepID=A0A835H0F4_9MAGN|nr:hypothetical protein IFM89_000471 [Coptis chinensis]